MMLRQRLQAAPSAFSIQTRSFGLIANKGGRHNKGGNLETRKSWVQPKKFTRWLLRRWKRTRFRKYIQQREVVLHEFKEMPHAVKTSAVGSCVERVVERFPNLAEFSQKSEQKPGRVRCLEDWKINNSAKHPNTFYKQPMHYQIFHMVHRDLIEKHPTTRQQVNFDFKPGDVVEIEMYTSLKKGTKHKFSGLCMERRQRGWETAIIIRNTEPDGFTYLRQFPIYSPWFISLKVKHRYRHFHLEHLRLLERNFPDIWNPEEVQERLEVIKQDIIDKRKHNALISQLKVEANKQTAARKEDEAFEYRQGRAQAQLVDLA